MNEVKWYENTPLDTIKSIIKDNINNASRAFIKIGFYLKDVRDRELFSADGYENIWEFAQAEFGISKSSASRFMAINDRFSVDGNSPELLEQYRDFSSSKLSEMLTMSNEQLEQVTITTTRAEIREIKQTDNAVAPAQQKVHQPEQEAVASNEKAEEALPLSPVRKINMTEQDAIDFTRGIDSLAKEYEAKGSCPQGIGGCMRNGEEGETGTKLCLKCWKEWLSREKLLVESKARKEQELQEEKQPDIPTFEKSGEPYGATRNEIIVSLVQEMVETDTAIGDIDGICCHAFGVDYYAYNMGTGYITIENEDEEPVFSTSVERFKGEYEWHKPKFSNLPIEDVEENEKMEIVNDSLDSANDKEEFQEKECGNCKYNDMTPDEFKSIDPDGGLPCNDCDHELNNWVPKGVTDTALPCDTCGHEDSSGCCNYDSEDEYCIMGNKWISRKEEAEIVEADVVQTESYDGLTLAKEVLARKQEQLNSWLRIKDPSPGEKKSIEKAKIEAGALAAYICDLDNTVNPIPKPVQPELPILKNNDQRKDFIDNYTSWPVWIDQGLTGERYYRYDLIDKVAIVVKVSRKHSWKTYKETKDYEYGAEQYYLLGVKSEWSQKGSKFVIDDGRTFYECNTNKSALVEYLKEFQKKG